MSNDNIEKAKIELFLIVKNLKNKKENFLKTVSNKAFIDKFESFHKDISYFSKDYKLNLHIAKELNNQLTKFFPASQAVIKEYIDELSLYITKQIAYCELRKLAKYTILERDNNSVLQEAMKHFYSQESKIDANKKILLDKKNALQQLKKTAVVLDCTLFKNKRKKDDITESFVAKYTYQDLNFANIELATRFTDSTELLVRVYDNSIYIVVKDKENNYKKVAIFKEGVFSIIEDIASVDIVEETKDGEDNEESTQ